MRRYLLILCACSSVPQVTVDSGTPDSGTADAGVVDAGEPDAGVADAGTVDAGARDAGVADAGFDCFPYGAPGVCESTSDCMAMSDHSSIAGHCPGPATIECCIVTPNVADNPHVPSGWKLMMQADVTTAMTDWAVQILNDPATYPMFSTAMMTFGALTVMARVEWHPPDFQNGAIHRGVTLYEPS